GWWTSLSSAPPSSVGVHPGGIRGFARQPRSARYRAVTGSAHTGAVTTRYAFGAYATMVGWYAAGLVGLLGYAGWQMRHPTVPRGCVDSCFGGSLILFATTSAGVILLAVGLGYAGSRLGKRLDPAAPPARSAFALGTRCAAAGVVAGAIVVAVLALVLAGI